MIDAADAVRALILARDEHDAETLVALARLAGALRAASRPAVAAKVAGVSVAVAEGVLQVVGKRRPVQVKRPREVPVPRSVSCGSIRALGPDVSHRIAHPRARCCRWPEPLRDHLMLSVRWKPFGISRK
jgi:hypothetical protein